jgi:hypothetical protein
MSTPKISITFSIISLKHFLYNLLLSDFAFHFTKSICFRFLHESDLFLVYDIFTYLLLLRVLIVQV